MKNSANVLGCSIILVFFLHCLRNIQETQVCHDQVIWVNNEGSVFLAIVGTVSVNIVAEVFTALSGGFKLFDALLRKLQKHSEGTAK